MTEYEIEPVPGLPGILPRGERILWQGSPDRRTLARTAFHTRGIASYFAVLTVIALVTALPHVGAGAGAFVGVAGTVGTGLVALALLNLLAWASARSTIYTITDARVVMRFGIALPKCVNLPLALIGAADLRRHAGGVGDLPLAIVGPQPLGYASYWPHARPRNYAAPQPMLRAVPEADRVAALLARACRAAGPAGRIVVAVEPERQAMPELTGVAA